MTLRTNIIGLAISGVVFVACCAAMLRFGQQMNSEAVVYPFIAVWGLSALAWPLFAVRLLRASLSYAFASLRRARRNRRGGYY
jgi:hypothetical protein